MIRAYKDFWKGYFKFSGRTTRLDYWWVVLVNAVIYLALVALVPLTAGNRLSEITQWHFDGSHLLAAVSFIAFNVYIVATFIPWLSLQYRRFTDAGVPKWLYVVAPVAAVLGIISDFTSASWIWGTMWAAWFVIFIVSVLPTDEDDEY